MPPVPPTSSHTPVPLAGFRVRAARRGDSDGLAVLLRELGYESAADSATLNWVISHPEIEVFVATDPQDRLVGMLSLSHRPQLRLKGRIVTIDELVVTSGWRRKGVGRALVQKALERGKSLSALRVELATHGPADEIVSAFRQSCGFNDAAVSVVSRKP